MRNFPEGPKMRTKTTAMWANTRFSERLGIKYAKEPVMEVLLGVALKTISTYVNHILLAVIDDAVAAEGQ
jgi:hypothetical protein